MTPCRYLRFERLLDIKRHAMRVAAKVIADIPEIKARWKDGTLGYTTLFKLVKAYCKLDAESPDWMHQGFYRRIFWDETYENVVFTKEMSSARVFRFSKTVWGVPWYVRQLRTDEATWLEERARIEAAQERRREKFLEKQAEEDEKNGIDQEDRAWLLRCKIAPKAKVTAREIAARARLVKDEETAREFVEGLIDSLRIIPAPKKDMRGRWERRTAKDHSYSDDL